MRLPPPCPLQLQASYSPADPNHVLRVINCKDAEGWVGLGAWGVAVWDGVCVQGGRLRADAEWGLHISRHGPLSCENGVGRRTNRIKGEGWTHGHMDNL